MKTLKNIAYYSLRTISTIMYILVFVPLFIAMYTDDGCNAIERRM